MHFGEVLEEARYIQAIQLAYTSGIRTFVSADVYGTGKADEILGVALRGIDRSTYCLVGTIGHDFYTGQRDGSKGYPRFTDPTLRGHGGLLTSGLFGVCSEVLPPRVGRVLASSR